MSDDPLFLIVAVACLIVLVILVFGVANFGKGGAEAGKRSNKLMRWRIYAQFFAIVVILGFVYLRQGG